MKWRDDLPGDWDDVDDDQVRRDVDGVDPHLLGLDVDDLVVDLDENI